MALSSPMKHIPRFDYTYLVAINIITCGIELCTSAAFCYLPPMLLEAGFSESLMSTIMALGPFCALFLLPIMGTMSDRCGSRYGRRKPFIFALTVGIAISLILLPYSTNIGALLGGVLPAKATSIVILAFSVVLLDFCTQVAYTPVESLLSDPCDNEEQHNRSFSVFTFMMSIGACLGYWISAIDWRTTRLGVAIGSQEHTLFAILLLTFLLTAIVSLLVINDPPMISDGDGDLKEVTVPLNGIVKPGDSKHKRHINGNIPNNNSIKSTTPTAAANGPSTSSPSHSSTPISFARRPLRAMMLYPCLLVASAVPESISKPVMETVQAMRTMPKALRRLWIANFLSCTAVMGFRLYFTDYVGEALYNGNPESNPDSVARLQYEEGIRMGTWGLFLHSVTSAMYSLVIQKFITSYGTGVTYLFGMVVFTIMTGIMSCVNHVSATILLAALTGLASATITTVPYALLSTYHEETEVYYQDMDPKVAHLHGKGADIALLDSAYIMAEVVSSFIFGIIVEVTSSTTSYIICSCLFGAVACYTIGRVRCV